MTANYLVCNIEVTIKQEKNKINRGLFFLLSESKLLPGRLLFHPLKEFLLKLLGKFIVRVELQGLLVILHHIHVVTLAVLGRILHNTHHIEETAKGADV